MTDRTAPPQPAPSPPAVSWQDLPPETRAAVCLMLTIARREALQRLQEQEND